VTSSTFCTRTSGGSVNGFCSWYVINIDW
jgi:hypothetical protein